MKIYEIGTGYTPIPAQIAAATESIVEELTKAFMKQNIDVEIIDICSSERKTTPLPSSPPTILTFFSAAAAAVSAVVFVFAAVVVDEVVVVDGVAVAVVVGYHLISCDII